MALENLPAGGSQSAAVLLKALLHGHVVAELLSAQT